MKGTFLFRQKYDKDFRVRNDFTNNDTILLSSENVLLQQPLTFTISTIRKKKETPFH